MNMSTLQRSSDGKHKMSIPRSIRAARVKSIPSIFRRFLNVPISVSSHKIPHLFNPAGLSNLTGRIETMGAVAFAFGGLADIWKGRFKDQPDTLGSMVAVKIIRTYTQDKRYVKDRNDRLVREAKVWSRLAHPNVTPFLGISFDVGQGQVGAPALICPYYSKGNLTKYLEDNTEANRFRLLAEAASALNYLHSLQPNGIIHGDMKASNILVNDDGHACLADFGLSRILEVRGFTTKSSGGTCRWMAYELVVPPEDEEDNDDYVPPLTRETDVWAFGMTILQVVLTGSVPYHNLIMDPAVIFAIIRRNLPERPPNLPNVVWRLLERCWDFSPTNRPSMRAVQFALEAYDKKRDLTVDELDAILQNAG
ncbi:kinase-like protein [Coprinellus micaceus]|uniref:Kinase-like protein n=1 Tax=Coprinellus micaceus TaxID=71717 RepID=A0A4Y7TU26_COPMI|nr:kinase-like protein [Coprinellus micaceus]